MRKVLKSGERTIDDRQILGISSENESNESNLMSLHEKMIKKIRSGHNV